MRDLRLSRDDHMIGQVHFQMLIYLGVLSSLKDIEIVQRSEVFLTDSRCLLHSEVDFFSFVLPDISGCLPSGANLNLLQSVSLIFQRCIFN